MKKKTILTKRNVIIASLLLISGCVFIMVFSSYLSAKRIGKAVGEGPGRVAGSITGAYEGFVDGTEKGKKEALTPENNVDVVPQIASMGELGVLEAEINSNDCLKISDDYVLLYSEEGKAVYVVDLTQAECEKKDNELNITLPKLKVNISLDSGSFKKVAEYQNGNEGTTEIGKDVYNRMRERLEKDLIEKFENDTELMSVAKDNAIEQVRELASTIVPDAEIKVRIQDGDWR